MAVADRDGDDPGEGVEVAEAEKGVEKKRREEVSSARTRSNVDAAAEDEEKTRNEKENLLSQRTVCPFRQKGTACARR